MRHLAAAVQTCTDEDLMCVHRDLQIGREILKLFKQLYELLLPYLPATWRTMPNELTVFFSFGRLFIWADLALRQQDFGPLLDQILPEMLDAIHKTTKLLRRRSLPRVWKLEKPCRRLSNCYVRTLHAMSLALDFGE